MEWKERISRILALGMYDRMTTPRLPKDVNRYVAAGNPGKTFPEYPASLSIPNTFEMGKRRCTMQDYTLYTVSGNSMLPEGIHSGYELLAKRVDSIGDVRFGDFIIITVDEKFYQYRHHGKKSHFTKKLRRAICQVDECMSALQLFNQLKGTFAEPLEKEEKQDLEESLNEARNFYGETKLFLSVTYHGGDIHYSFHPSSNISCCVEGIAYANGADIKFKTTSELTA